ncbi:hypothetical protein WICPIJ_007846 [Wickerhamomyces pijperi]|uniref:Cyclin-D1-binding protein 1-like N-terminal domain-containing protein n=1 Tax=Wickerhamomyces pijperi TaxID=599730 RepID=A0A9P8TJI2_WICPI|nr:hypothetical protein WICPIJ_007846 [Wickerhamomyces pijperi]
MSETVDHSEEELRVFIKSFAEILKVSKDSLYAETVEDNNVKAQDLTAESIKLIQLIYAHTTKIGIAFRPPVSINAAYAQIKEISQYFFLLVSLVPLFQEDPKFSKFFVSELKVQVSKLISTYTNFLKELGELNFTEKADASTSNSVDHRLVSIGITWDMCDGLKKLILGGNLELLKENLKQSIALVDDAFEEFGEWIELPEKCDDTDPFGFNGAEEDDDDDDASENGDDKDDSEHIDPQLLSMAKKWHSKVKLIKLLLSSLSKSLPTDESGIKGADLEKFNQEQDHLIGLVDDLVSSFFTWSPIGDVQSYADEIVEQCKNLIEMVKMLNKGDDSKIKWLKIWLERFVEN